MGYLGSSNEFISYFVGFVLLLFCPFIIIQVIVSCHVVLMKTVEISAIRFGTVGLSNQNVYNTLAIVRLDPCGTLNRPIGEAFELGLI